MYNIKHSDLKGNFKFREPVILINGEPTHDYIRERSKAFEEYCESKYSTKTNNFNWDNTKIELLEQRIIELESLVKHLEELVYKIYYQDE